MKYLQSIFFLIFISISCSGNVSCKGLVPKGHEKSPRIINIVNFIRQNDYRLNNSEELLFKTVQEQIKLVNKYDFPATFLFQYDALIDPRYQVLMKTQLNQERCEIGAWWEITQPQVEAAGLKWRGEHSWVSTANIAFTPGYTQPERKKLVDVYMEKFKEIYGKYPKSVGSWFIDSYTLQYMYEKYGIVASCNCKDQIGTDGYTLWGGYWNQAYYPSKKNAYMPAQTKDGQIPVPIFRMLGSDPMYQYDAGIGTHYQGVISLEPVYQNAGKSKKWVKYFIESIVNEPCLAFNYAQAGQENSFTWSGMGEGLEMQFPIFDSLRVAGRIKIETLEQAGKWFKEKFSVTPATAITTLIDIHNEGNKSVWYNSRYYRANLFWEKDGFCFRDIHLFDENFQSQYLETPGSGSQFFYYTLPVIDRFHWSTPEDKTGLRFVCIGNSGNKSDIVLMSPIVTEPTPSTLRIESTSKEGCKYIIEMNEDNIIVSSDSKSKWMLELKVPTERIEKLPFMFYEKSKIDATFKGYKYAIRCKEGGVNKGNNSDYVFRFIPSANNKIIISCSAN